MFICKKNLFICVIGVYCFGPFSNFLKYVHFVHEYGRKLHTFAFLGLNFKDFWTVVIYPFYEQINLYTYLLVHIWTLVFIPCFCCLQIFVHGLDIIYLGILDIGRPLLISLHAFACLLVY